MQATTFTSVLGYLGSLFKTIIYKLDDFYLVGSFSIFDFIIACLVIDIVITAFFVAFRVGNFGSPEDVQSEPSFNRSPEYQYKAKETGKIDSNFEARRKHEAEVNRLKYW